MAPIPFNIIVGTAGAFTVTALSRPRQPTDTIYGKTAAVVRLSNASATYEPLVFEDDPGGQNSAYAAAQSIVSGFAAIGALTSFATPGGKPIQETNPNQNLLIYTRSALLTPGTPLPPGRGVFFRNIGGAYSVTMKLAGGGVYPVDDPTSGFGKRHDNIAAVDADVVANAPLSPSAKPCEIYILY